VALELEEVHLVKEVLWGLGMEDSQEEQREPHLDLDLDLEVGLE